MAKPKKLTRKTPTQAMLLGPMNLVELRHLCLWLGLSRQQSFRMIDREFAKYLVTALKQYDGEIDLEPLRERRLGDGTTVFRESTLTYIVDVLLWIRGLVSDPPTPATDYVDEDETDAPTLVTIPHVADVAPTTTSTEYCEEEAMPEDTPEEKLSAELDSSFSRHVPLFQPRSFEEALQMRNATKGVTFDATAFRSVEPPSLWSRVEAELADLKAGQQLLLAEIRMLRKELKDKPPEGGGLF